ncbi:MAG: cell division protein FtsA [Elusimicrobia bacterium]|jgi:cell division protein FtsA|nr:cell division protein FtsA [Elusimicrobiota bacterium]
MREKILCGLDIGSGSVSAIIAGCDFSEDNLNVNIMGKGEAHCNGLKNGVVVNIKNTYSSICKAVEKAEEEAEVKVKDIIVNINGNHIKGRMHQGSTKIARTENEITEEDVERVINSARTTVPLSSDRNIIHAIPMDFKVDSNSGVQDPVGMDGNHLEVEVMLITGLTAPENNLNKCITRAGLGVEAIIANPLPPAVAVVAEEEKKLGCIMVDIGEETVNIAIFIGGKLNYISEIDTGSAYITHDLAYGLKTSFSEAKRIKEEFGHASQGSSLDREIEYIGVDGHTKRKALNKNIDDIIASRTEEIVEEIASDIERSGKEQYTPGGIILTGGGAKLKGLDEVINRRLSNLQVRIGRPREINGKVDEVNFPEYSMAVGLINYYRRQNSTNGAEGGYRVNKEGIWIRIKRWLEDMC